MSASNGHTTSFDTDRALDELYAFWPEQPAVQLLPEAPSSANVRVLFAGHEIQLTVRGHSEANVLERLERLLKRADIRPLPRSVRGAGGWKKGGSR
jgi:hypothetical protein